MRALSRFDFQFQFISSLELEHQGKEFCTDRCPCVVRVRRQLNADLQQIASTTCFVLLLLLLPVQLLLMLL